jgi:CHAT domain-containing protein/Tfp pilus assembly protein PilF
MKRLLVMAVIVLYAFVGPAQASAPRGAGTPATPEPASGAAPKSSLTSELQRLNAAALDYYAKGDLQNALNSLTRQLEVCRQLKDRDCEGGALGDIAYLNDEMGRYNTALQYYQQCLAIKRDLGDQPTVAVTLNNIGLVYRSLGQFDKALAAYDQALQIWQTLNDASGKGTTLNNIGTTYLALSAYERALDMFQQSLVYIRQLNERANESRTMSNIGLVRQNQGQYSEALRDFEQALAIAREVKSSEQQATLLGNIGALYQAIGDYPKALDYLNQCLQITQSFSNPASQAVALNNLAVIYDNQGDYARAIEYYRKSLDIVRQQGDMPHVATMLGNLGLSYENLGKHEQADSIIRESLNLARQIGDVRTQATALNNLGMLHYNQQQYAQALEIYQQALPLMKQVDDPLAESKVIKNIGQSYEGSGELDQALGAYRQSIAIQEDVRASAGVEELKTSLAGQSASVYEKATLLLMRMNRPQEAFDMAERARARTFLDQLGNTRIDVRKGADTQLVQQEQDLRLELQTLQRSLAQQHALPQNAQNAEVLRSLGAQIHSRQQDYETLLTRIKLSNPEYASLVSVSPLTLTQIQQRLDADTTLLDYYVTLSATLAFVITHDSFTAYTLTVSPADLSAVVNQFRRFDDLSSPSPATLRKLYDWLIAPLKGQLHTRVLGIVPHGILHYLPFAALPLPAAGRFLMDDYTLFQLPSASILPFVQNKHKDTGNSALALAMSAPPGFEALQYAAGEAREVAALFGAQPLLDQAATETAFDAQAGQARLVHVAAHGELNQANSLFSRIMLAPDQTNDGALEVHEVYGLTLQRTDLVVLSACDTQLGKQSLGDDIVGLNRAFIYAGAPTVVASLWSVNDEATGLLMASFYRHLKAGMGKAEALRAAQADTRVKYPNPFYWAAFVLTGDPGDRSPVGVQPTWAMAGAGAGLLVLGAVAAFLILRRRHITPRNQQQAH